MRVIEITTRIGCRIQCKYCPQQKLIEAYRKRSDVFEMSFDIFKKYLSKIPSDVCIQFSGMSEPLLNPECTKMVLYAHEKGYKIGVYTTCVGMKKEDIDLIKHIPFEIFEVHLADGDGYTKIKMDEEYLRLINKINKSGIKNLRYMTMGKMPLKLEKLLRLYILGTKMTSRAGNIDEMPKLKKLKGKIKCFTGNKQNTLLPNGDVILCCMDYKMNYILGNLLKSDYESLFKSENFKKIQEGMKNDSLEILCRYCEYAKEINESTFNKFRKFIKWAPGRILPVSKKIFRNLKYNRISI